jgi:hypothetical protein
MVIGIADLYDDVNARVPRSTRGTPPPRWPISPGRARSWSLGSAPGGSHCPCRRGVFEYTASRPRSG